MSKRIIKFSDIITGVSNMTALGNVISWQKVDYDFNFHKQEFPANIVTLVLSEGKSILKVNLPVLLIKLYI
jgi:hypothetical protein